MQKNQSFKSLQMSYKSITYTCEMYIINVTNIKRGSMLIKSSNHSCNLKHSQHNYLEVMLLFTVSPSDVVRGLVGIGIVLTRSSEMIVRRSSNEVTVYLLITKYTGNRQC